MNHPRFSPALLLCFLLFTLVPAANAQMQFEENVWVSFADFRTVTDIAVGRNEIYFASTGGVLHYDRYRQVWLNPWVIVRGLEESVDLRGAANVDYLSETNQIAVLTLRGAYLYDPIAQFWVPTDHSFDSPQTVQVNQSFFIDLPGQNISKRSYFQQGNDAVMDSDLRRHELSVFADDDWGNRWIGVKSVGVLRLDVRMWRGELWNLGLYGTDVRSIVRGGGWTIFAGHNRDRGITFWKPKTNIWDYLEPRYQAGLESSWINDLIVSGSWLLAATDYGVAQIDLKNGTCRTWTIFDGLWSNAVTSVAADKDTVWVGTEDGVCVLYLPRGPIKRIETPALKNQPVYRLAVDRQAVWVGGELGLYRMDRASGIGEFLDEESGVGGPVFALHSTPSEIWVGRYMGLEVVKKADLEQTGYPAQAFFGGAAVNAVLPVDSLVYVGTDQGLWKFDRFRNRWHQYTEADGLLDNRVTAVFPDGDHLLLGTPAGVTRFFWNDPNRTD